MLRPRMTASRAFFSLAVAFAVFVLGLTFALSGARAQTSAPPRFGHFSASSQISATRTPPASPESVSNGLIAYVKSNNGNFESIKTMNADGSHRCTNPDGIVRCNLSPSDRLSTRRPLSRPTERRSLSLPTATRRVFWKSTSPM